MIENEEFVRQGLRSAAASITVRPAYSDVEGGVRRSRRRRLLVATTTVAGVVIVAGLVLASKDPSTKVSVVQAAPDTTAATGRPATAPAVRIDTDPVERVGGRANLINGNLRVDEARGCLFLVDASGERFHLVFPRGSTVVSDPLRVLDANGVVFATVNEPVGFGGSIADPTAVEPSDATCGASWSIYVWKA